jgi:hypothetical protein
LHLAPEDAEVFARWSEDCEYMRNLDTDFAVPRSVDFYRSDLQANVSQTNAIEVS